ncbi:MAG: hypothetical protein SPE59_10545 [Treponema sp.]|nr:hypothetical protein [Treponema sp.]
MDPDGSDIKDSEIYSFSIGVGIAGRLSCGIAKDSNHKTAIFVRTELGLGVGGSIAKYDKALNAIDTGSQIVKDIVNDYKAIETLDNVVPNNGEKNFDGKITHNKETVKDWKSEGKSIHVEAAVIVGANSDEKGNLEITIGATAIASAYFRKDTWYFDITKVTIFMKQQLDKIIKHKEE